MDLTSHHPPQPTPGRAVTDPACPDCPGQATPGHVCPGAGRTGVAPIPGMTYPTPGGHVVTITAVPGSRIPYDWACTAGHHSEQSYAALPYCRDDAQEHVRECAGTVVEQAEPRTAEAERHADSALSAIAYHLSTNDWGNARRVLAEYTSDTARRDIGDAA